MDVHLELRTNGCVFFLYIYIEWVKALVAAPFL